MALRLTRLQKEINDKNEEIRRLQAEILSESDETSILKQKMDDLQRKVKQFENTQWDNTNGKKDGVWKQMTVKQMTSLKQTFEQNWNKQMRQIETQRRSLEAPKANPVAKGTNEPMTEEWLHPRTDAEHQQWNPRRE